MATFKTRARTLDMLGRQQIAGIPTAISELFKNAHDAYATRAEVDYYRSDKLFVLRDDGIGMTSDDFKERWLTLGTESKIVESNMPPKPLGMKERPILGEKGIGRLSVAIIGPQILVLTKAIREEKLCDIVAAYIHWGVFEIPGINLDEIEIPVYSFPGGCFPSRNDVESMTTDFRKNLDVSAKWCNNDRIQQIKAELDEFDVDPIEIADYLETPSLKENGHGTWFIIKPASELLELDIDESSKDKASRMDKSLMGFTQTMTPDHKPPVITTTFKDHKTDTISNDLIADKQFFTPDEFLNADHRIWGKFDDFGQFEGTVSVYGEEHQNHIIPWKEAAGKTTLCGPFNIDFACIPGETGYTTLPFQEHALMTQKMDRLGGLYIYRDGIRILPYGDTDYDWLDIELRRSKGYGYYFFSYRRIFGVVSITQKANVNLKEKAGREGFRENRAYRQLKSILKNFLIQVAADFFREASPNPRFKEIKEELTRLDKARIKREKSVAGKRRKLEQELVLFFKAYDSGRPQKEGMALIESISEQLNLIKEIDDKKKAAEALLNVEAEARHTLGILRKNYTITRPSGIGLNRKTEREWNQYKETCAELEETVFSDVNYLIEREIGELATQARLEIDRRIRIERALAELDKEALKATRAEGRNTSVTLDGVEKEVRDATSKSLAKVESELKAIWSEFSSTDVNKLDDDKVVEFRSDLEKRILDAKDSEVGFLQYIRSQLEAINLIPEETGLVDQMEAMEQHNLLLEERADMDLQLTQLGMAVDVINHEFNSNVNMLRDKVRELKGWADINEGMQDLYNDFRVSFEHLDGYLTLFTPLNRRLHRTKVDIKGKEIHRFLENLFGERFQRHNIKLQTSNAFIKQTITSFPSSIYPVFVNLVDNSIFWIGFKSTSGSGGTILLDAVENAFIVADEGPGIAKRDMESVFEQGFTRKPGGRGLGLFISREILNRIGFALNIVESKTGWGATFRIGEQGDMTNERERND